jgi:hypothetical protein
MGHATFANAIVGTADGPTAEPLARMIADKRSGREVTRVTTTEAFRWTEIRY